MRPLHIRGYPNLKDRLAGLLYQPFGSLELSAYRSMSYGDRARSKQHSAPGYSVCWDVDLHPDDILRVANKPDRASRRPRSCQPHTASNLAAACNGKRTIQEVADLLSVLPSEIIEQVKQARDDSFEVEAVAELSSTINQYEIS